jgi:hypothetical protein
LDKSKGKMISVLIVNVLIVERQVVKRVKELIEVDSMMRDAVFQGVLFFFGFFLFDFTDMTKYVFGKF